MLSILNNTQHSNQIEFHYAINNISQKDKSILKQLAKKYKSKINFYGFDDERLKNYPLLFNNPNAYPAYYRIYFGEILPQNIKKYYILTLIQCAEQIYKKFIKQT